MTPLTLHLRNEFCVAGSALVGTRDKFLQVRKLLSFVTICHHLSLAM